MASNNVYTTTGHQSSIDEIIEVMEMLGRPFWTVWDSWTVSNRNSYKMKFHDEEDLELSKSELRKYLELIGKHGGKFTVGFAKQPDSTAYSKYRLWLQVNSVYSRGTSSISGQHLYDPALGISGNTSTDHFLLQVRADERQKVEMEHKLADLEARINEPSENDFFSKIERLPEPFQIGLINMCQTIISKFAYPAGAAMNGAANVATQSVPVTKEAQLEHIKNQMAAMEAMKAQIENQPDEVEDSKVPMSEDPDIDNSIVRISQHFDVQDLLERIANFIDKDPELAKSMFNNYLK